MTPVPDAGLRSSAAAFSSAIMDATGIFAGLGAYE